MPHWKLLLAIPAFLVVAGGTQAQRGDSRVAEGQQLAETWCGSCHVVGRTPAKVARDISPPPFAAIAERPTTTADGLTAFLQVSHGRMLDYHLSRPEIARIVAYIMSLRGQTPGARGSGR